MLKNGYAKRSSNSCETLLCKAIKIKKPDIYLA
jgi:hypothetical protein